MPDIFEFAVRPASLSVALEAVAPAGVASITLDMDASTGGSLSPPTLDNVFVASYSSLTLSADQFFGPGTHTGSDWQIDEAEEDFSTPILESLDDASNLESITFDSSSLTQDGDYIARVRYTDSIVGDSDWSATKAFTNTPAATWPNAMVGATVHTNFDISAELLGEPTQNTKISKDADWLYLRRKDIGEVVTDNTAPSGRGKSWRHKYPANKINEGGEFSEACVLQFTMIPQVTDREGYFGIVMKRSSNWVNHQVGDKLAHWYNGGTQIHWFCGDPGSKVNLTRDIGNPFQATFTIAHGTWYMWEWYMKRPVSFPGTAELKLWISTWSGSAWGAPALLINDTETFSTDEDRWNRVEFSGTYGGGNDPDIGEDQYLYFDAATFRTK